MFLEIPYSLKWNRGEFEGVWDGQSFRIRFERIFERRVQAPGIDLHFTAPVDIQQDRQGRLAHTRIEIIFPPGTPDPFDEWPESDRRSLQILNRFLDVYRTTMEEWHIQPLIMSDLNGMRFMTSLADGSPGSTIGGSLGYGQAIGPATVATIPSEATKLLESGVPIRPHVSFMEAAKTARVYKQHRQAVVDAETAVEVRVAEALPSLDKHVRGAPAQVDQHIRATGLKVVIRDCIDAKKLTPIYASWEANLASLRHRIVHQGYTPSRKEVDDAISAGEAFIDWLDGLAP